MIKRNTFGERNNTYCDKLNNCIIFIFTLFMFTVMINID